MIRTLAPLFGNWPRAVTVILGIGAAAGWGILAISSQSAAETERQLQERIATLQDSQKQLERDQSQGATAELARLRNQLSSAQDEIARLAQSRTQAQLKMPADRLPLDANSSPARLSQNGISQTGSLRSLPPTPPQAPPRPVQAAPTKPQNSVIVVQAGDKKRQGPEQAPVLKPRG